MSAALQEQTPMQMAMARAVYRPPVTALEQWLTEIGPDAKIVRITTDQHESGEHCPCGICGSSAEVQADAPEYCNGYAGYRVVRVADIEFTAEGYEPGELLGDGDVPVCVWCLAMAKRLAREAVS